MEKITNLSDSVKVIAWNRRVLRISGIWPLDIWDLIFLPYFTYGCLIISTGGCIICNSSDKKFEYGV
ncbi:hypothetical protein KPH14_012716 [Odynerus spinipes]|uniref:Uncharacterized protein n=1 Tax=Odynerus spinipes TaxID=1348599 RepID=A0AAD9R893_9HYME|nr:hypothetical protein KPH14_012716 [Odynerus spinipes]